MKGRDRKIKVYSSGSNDKHTQVAIFSQPAKLEIDFTANILNLLDFDSFPPPVIDCVSVAAE